MKHIKNMWRCNSLFLLFLGVCCHALAQNIAFIASPSATKIGVKDNLQITFTIKNVENLRDFRPQGFGDFTPIGGPYQSESVSIDNGATSSSRSFIYVVRANHEGKLSIPGAIARDAAGHNYTSNGVTIEVVPGSIAPPPQARRQEEDDPFQQMAQQMQRMNQWQQQLMQQQQQAMAMRQASPQQQQRMQQQQAQQQQAQAQAQQQAQQEPTINDPEIKNDLFIKVTVDKSKVHVGEQITAYYKLYCRIPAQIGISKLPSFNGFWPTDFDRPKNAQPVYEVVNGKKYEVVLLKKAALFPQEVGVLELDPTEAKGVARIVKEVKRRVSDLFNDPFGNGTLAMNDPFFNNSFFKTMAYKDVNVHLQSTPLKITVTQLPEKGKPADYTGAVGKFDVSAKMDKTDITTDDVAALTLKITGTGNVKLIDAPKLGLPNGITTYDPQVIDTITGRSTAISGSKIFTYAITPQAPGDYTVPSIPFSYFDPATGTYTTLQTQPFTVHVKPGKHPLGSHTASGPTIVLKDIHEIETGAPANLSLMSKPLMLTPIYMSMYLLPLMAFVGMVFWRKKNDELSNNSMMMRNKRANKVALKRLVTAKTLLGQNQRKPFYEEISKAIWLYLSDKLGIPLSALSRDTAIAALIERKVPDIMHRQFNDLIWECETALYATGGSKPLASTYDDAVKLIGDFEDFI